MIVLTGGAGFIGSCFLHKLNSEGIKDILVVDHLGCENKWKNLVGKKFIRFEHKSIFREKINSGKYCSSDIEYFVHFGACSKTTERDADYIMDNNLNYSIDLAEFAFKYNIPFMYASSAATYGDGQNGYSDRKFDSLKPLNAYGLSKHLFDEWILANGYENRIAGLKFFNVFGPNEYHKQSMTSMVYKSYKQISETGRVGLFKSNSTQYADGEQMRDFVYSKDVVDVLFEIFKTNGKVTGIFNLGTGKARNWNSLAAAVFHAMNKEVNIDYIDMPEGLTKQYQNYTQADMGKLEAAGIKHNFMSLEEGVTDYVQNYLMKDFKIL